MPRLTRRDILRTFGSAGLAAVAGCGADRRTASPTRTEPLATASPSPTAEPPSETSSAPTTDPPSESSPTPTETESLPARVEWSYQTGDGVESSPVVVDGTVFLGSRDQHVYALDTERGTEQWTLETDGWVLGGPTVVDDTVFVGGRYESYAVAAAGGSVRWTTRRATDTRSTPTVVDGTVFFASYDRHVYAVDAETGELLWRAEAGMSQHSQLLCSPAVAEGTVVVATGDSSVVALDAESGTELWRSIAAGRVQADPLIRDGTVYVGDAEGVATYALDSGERLGRVEIPRVEGMSYADGNLYLGCIGAAIYAVGTETGEIRWEHRMEESPDTAPTVVDGTVYVATADGDFRDPGSVWSLGAEDGQENWRVSLSTGVRTDPAVTETSVIVGTDDGRVLSISR